jgi:DNA-binding NarL/FixJ family response regulator
MTTGLFVQSCAPRLKELLFHWFDIAALIVVRAKRGLQQLQTRGTHWMGAGVASRGIVAGSAGHVAEADSVDDAQPAGPLISLALIGGSRLMRDLFAGLLASQHGLRLTGVFESATEFLAGPIQSAPDVLLLDCDEDPHGGRCTVSVLIASGVESKLVVLCEDASEELVRCALEHRLSGVLLKSYSAEDIRAALAYMASGRTIMPSGWQRALASSSPSIALSARHREILALIAQGRRTSEIAGQLGLSPNTIKFHISALYARLGVRNRVEATHAHAQMSGCGFDP